MPPKPCLGYPTRTAAAAALIAEGHSPGEVAARIGISVSQLSSLVGADGRPRKEPGVGPGAKPSETMTTIAFARETIDALRPHARRRDIGVEALVRAIVDTVALDRMVDAVLDDREDGR